MGHTTPPTQALDRTRRKRDIRAYRALSVGIPVFFATYATIVLAVESKPGREEIFPIASWSLFSKVPHIADDFTLRILAVNGVSLETPLFFSESGKYFRGATSHMPHNAIQRLGKAVESGAPEVDDIRARFEDLYLTPYATDVRYEVVARRYDPLVRWRTGAFVSVRVLRTFATAAQ